MPLVPRCPSAEKDIAMDDKQLITLPEAYAFRFRSEIMDETYRVHIAMPHYAGMPELDQKDQTFRILYTADGNWFFNWLVNNIRLQTADPDAPIEQLIIVAVGYDLGDDLSPASVLRHRDFGLPGTPNISAGAPENPYAMEIPAGKADKFLSFFEDELDPYIRQIAPCDGGLSTYFGASLGAYFGLFSLFNRSKLFDTYILISAAMLEDPDRMFDIEEACWENGSELPARVFLSVGNEERRAALPSFQLIGLNFDRMLMRLSERGYQRLDVVHKEYLEGTHFSHVGQALSDALRAFHPGQNPYLARYLEAAEAAQDSIS